MLKNPKSNQNIKTEKLADKRKEKKVIEREDIKQEEYTRIWIKKIKKEKRREPRENYHDQRVSLAFFFLKIKN